MNEIQSVNAVVSRQKRLSSGRTACSLVILSAVQLSAFVYVGSSKLTSRPRRHLWFKWRTLRFVAQNPLHPFRTLTVPPYLVSAVNSKVFLRPFLAPHLPTPAPQIWWFSSDIARSINLLTYLITYTCFSVTSPQTKKLQTCCGLVSDTANYLDASNYSPQQVGNKSL